MLSFCTCANRAGCIWSNKRWKSRPLVFPPASRDFFFPPASRRCSCGPLQFSFCSPAFTHFFSFCLFSLSRVFDAACIWFKCPFFLFFFSCFLFCCYVQSGGQVLDTVFTTLSLSPSCAYRNAHTRAHSCQAPPVDHLAVMLGAPPLPFNPSPPFLLLLFHKIYNQKCEKIFFIGFSGVILNLRYFLHSNLLGIRFLFFVFFLLVFYVFFTRALGCQWSLHASSSFYITLNCLAWYFEASKTFCLFFFFLQIFFRFDVLAWFGRSVGAFVKWRTGGPTYERLPWNVLPKTEFQSNNSLLHDIPRVTLDSISYWPIPFGIPWSRKS